MPEDPKSAPGDPEQTVAADAAPKPSGSSEQKPSEGSQLEKDQEIGDFITRHVLEKDSVFFEG